METITLDRMAKRKSPPPAPAAPPKPADAHKPRWQVYIPPAYKAGIQALRDRIQRANGGVEVDLSELIKRAVRELLEREGVWPPQES